MGYTYRRAAEAGGNYYLLLRGTGPVNYGHYRAAGHYQLANGVRLYYETYGQGAPLLLLHGNGESINSFRYQIAALARHYQVIASDTYDLFAQDMLALLDALPPPAAHVVGWNDGGNTGLSLTLHHPRAGESLVMMGANLFADTTAIAGRLLRPVQPARDGGPRRLNALLAHYPRLTPAELVMVRVPMLVLAGEQGVIKDAHTRLIVSSILGTQLLLLPGLTHYAPQEKPELFNQVV